MHTVGTLHGIDVLPWSDPKETPRTPVTVCFTTEDQAKMDEWWSNSIR